jgi:hypothetical protein
MGDDGHIFLCDWVGFGAQNPRSHRYAQSQHAKNTGTVDLEHDWVVVDVINI